MPLVKQTASFSLLQNIHFIIVEPRTPGNIGSLCRACKKMGITNVVLVNPVPYLVDETFKFGWGAEDLIRSVRVVSNLAEILPEMQMIVGTSQRQRKNQIPFFSAPDIAAVTLPAAQKHKVAFLFGRENNGLSNEELQTCHLLSSVPGQHSYPALNLSQAVMIYAYELYQKAHGHEQAYPWQLAQNSETELLYTKIEEVLQNINFPARHGHKAFVDMFRRVFGRTQLEKRDIRLFLKLFEALQKNANNHDHNEKITP